MSFLERIQSKPNHVKAYYSFGCAGLITGIIGMVWISALPARFNNQNAEVAVQEKEKSNIDELFDTTKSQLANIVTTQKDITDSALVDGETNAMEALAIPETSASLEVETPHALTSFGATGTMSASSATTTTPPVGKAFDAHTQETAQKGESTQTVPQGSRTILIESEDTPQRVILIGTSSVQNSE